MLPTAFLTARNLSSREHHRPVIFVSADRVLINPKVGAGIQQERGRGRPVVQIRRGLDLIRPTNDAVDLQSGISIQQQTSRRQNLRLWVEGNVPNPVISGVGDKYHAL